MNVEDPIKNKGANNLTVRFFRHSRTAYSEVRGGIPLKFELIQVFMVVRVTCKNEENPIKNKGSRVLTYHCKSMRIFSNAQGQLTAVCGRIRRNFELVRDIIVVLLACKCEEDPIINEGVRVLTRLYLVFQTFKGSLLRSQRLNSAEIQTHPSFYSCPPYLQE